jgi:phosphopantetheine adenylyltransferase
VQIDEETAIQKPLVFRLRDGEQVVKDLRVSFELATVDFEGGGTGSDKDDIAVFEPETAGQASAITAQRNEKGNRKGSMGIIIIAYESEMAGRTCVCSDG